MWKREGNRKKNNEQPLQQAPEDGLEKPQHSMVSWWLKQHHLQPKKFNLKIKTLTI